MSADLLIYNIGKWDNSSMASTTEGAVVVDVTQDLMASECVMEGVPEQHLNLAHFGCWYAGVHGYASIVVCTIGIIANIFNIIILTKKNMVTSTNCLLTGLAVSDFFTMASYIPFALHFYVAHERTRTPDRNSLAWMRFFMFNATFGATTHTISIWLGVCLALFRYLYIKLAHKGIVICTLPRAKISVVSIYIFAVLINVPNYLTTKIYPILDITTNRTLYVLHAINVTVSDYEDLATFNLWLYALAAKLIPCLLMILFGGLLLATLQHAKRKGTNLLKQNKQQRISDSFKNRMREHSRTTRMLVTVIILFLITELPQGILLVMSLRHEYYFRYVYTPLGDLMDLVALLNNGINIVLYCSMSRTFREHFFYMVCGCFLKNKQVFHFRNRRHRGTESTTI